MGTKRPSGFHAQFPSLKHITGIGVIGIWVFFSTLSAGLLYRHNGFKTFSIFPSNSSWDGFGNERQWSEVSKWFEVC
jgi:hypothetical protein